MLKIDKAKPKDSCLCKWRRNVRDRTYVLMGCCLKLTNREPHESASGMPYKRRYSRDTETNMYLFDSSFRFLFNSNFFSRLRLWQICCVFGRFSAFHGSAFVDLSWILKRCLFSYKSSRYCDTVSMQQHVPLEFC